MTYKDSSYAPEDGRRHGAALVFYNSCMPYSMEEGKAVFDMYIVG